MHLRTASLAQISDGVPVPTYDRTAVSVGIVHLSVGGFHRSHQAMYLDRLMEQGKAMDWGICGVGLLPADVRMRDVLTEQDRLYTLVLKHPDGTLEPRVIGSVVDYLYAPDDPEAVIEVMAAPTTRIVSMTVTEGGYNVHPVTSDFDERNPAVQRDLAPGAIPTTAFGLVTEALRRRRTRGVPAFTVLSCDNVQGNGEVARRAFSAFARLTDPELGAWVATEVSFPSSMVDRITPVTSDEDRQLVNDRFGIDDGWPVVAEPFVQWVLEDKFPQGRPPLEDAGVQLVADVMPYELMKLRLLNASHQAMCYLGHLAGYRYAHEVCQDDDFVEFLSGYMDEEATPTLEPVPGVDLPSYKRQLIERFANPHIQDTLARLCAESSDRIPKWLLPVIAAQLTSSGAMWRSATVVAAWARYCEGTDEQGQPIEVIDALRDRLMGAAARRVDAADAFIADRELFGDLVEQPRFRDAYLEALDSLHRVGAREALSRVRTHGPH
jgi:mannitol 2-dehydrogenase